MSSSNDQEAGTHRDPVQKRSRYADYILRSLQIDSNRAFGNLDWNDRDDDDSSSARRHLRSRRSAVRNGSKTEIVHSIEEVGNAVVENNTPRGEESVSGGEPSAEEKRKPRIKIVWSYQQQQQQEHISPFPTDIAVANKLNGKVEFFTKLNGVRYKYPGGVKIKYDRNQLLNFNRLIPNGFSENDLPPVDNKARALPNDFQDKELLFKSVYKYKKDYTVGKLVPNETDKEVFNILLQRSSKARFVNSNISLSYQQKISKLADIRIKFLHGRYKPVIRSGIGYIYINGFEIKTLYPSPYPESVNFQRIVHICSYCLHYCSSRYEFSRHDDKCLQKLQGRPPGTEVYRDKEISIFEVDGREEKLFCRNLCLLSMLFLKSKTLYYEVEPFMFYVLYKNEGEFIGYFSKEKVNSTGFNLSCIITLPTYRRAGYGHLLMEFSYLLSRREYKLGTPEKPLSDLGLLTYRNYWKIKCAETLLFLHKKNCTRISLNELSSLTGLTTTDIVFGLEQLKVICCRKNITRPRKKDYGLYIDNWDRIQQVYDAWRSKGYVTLKSDSLLWKPMIYGPSSGVNAIISHTSNTEPHLEEEDPPVDFFNKQMSSAVRSISEHGFGELSPEDITIAEINQRAGETADDDVDDEDSENWHVCVLNSNGAWSSGEPLETVLRPKSSLSAPSISDAEDEDDEMVTAPGVRNHRKNIHFVNGTVDDGEPDRTGVSYTGTNPEPASPMASSIKYHR
ncbi:histone acetyltransferase KNAG_0B02490 [Huiozyma naganishii CBS 8797]|uniref:Histone acetyltransferase n=1 Tax=Huiozyma naganishii (strain ATCC MYA-139 / BCRC 22969 / CBS 8797 / KCTC 17520 / NBRC 10181 / NCYC 3082 / Yp74L-3) TaxID=1071383 RepID=J7R1J6_HUIN7|nr:hypothetical protein KNAG_0B02490 [Kazachstania naganishii CBS 8797]CCK68690.1 hypothetical protein KNAG_0B02490 [Kazachstania naganishii CBS 8797]